MEIGFGPYRLKPQQREIAGPRGPVELSARSFDILALLLRKPGEVISKDELFNAVWSGVAVEENTLQVHVSALRKALDPAYIVTVHGRGYKYGGPAPVMRGGEAAPATADAMAGAGRKPVIAVLPFANLSGDPDQQYFSDGITQDIIDRLSKYRLLSVIGHDSSLALRDTSPSEARRRLNADYVVSGNVRRSGPRIRISVRLTDTRSGSALWAEHYDRALEDIFSVQDEVAAIVASTLMGRVEIETGTRETTAKDLNLSSYELVLQGMWHYRKLTREGAAAATRCFERAIAEHPHNAEAYRYLAICYIGLWWDDFLPEGLTRSVATALRGVELDPLSATCHQALGACRLWAEGTDAAAPSYARALDLNPGDPAVLVEVGVFHVFRGDITTGRSYIDQAFKLNPVPPPWYHEFRGLADFAEGRYAEALRGFEPITEPAIDIMYRLACLGHLGETDKARALRTRLAAAGHHWDFMAGAAQEPYCNPEVRERLIDGLKRALSV